MSHLLLPVHINLLSDAPRTNNAPHGARHKTQRNATQRNTKQRQLPRLGV